MTQLSADDYRTLIHGALPVVTDAGTEGPALSSLFSPWSHRHALQPDITVVQGGRGAGKTFWYETLLDDSLREIAADEYDLPRLADAKTVPGFSARGNKDAYPDIEGIEFLLETGVRPYDLWFAVFLGRLGVPEFAEITRWADRIAWVRANPDRTAEILEDADNAAQDAGQTILVLFDALDHLHRERVQADRLIRGLLEVALRMRLRTRSVRCKVFIRPDMFTDDVLQFPDASKLGRAATLTWEPIGLYGLFFHLLGNDAGRPDTARTFREVSATAAASAEWSSSANGGRFVVPGELAGDQDTQERVFHSIAGKYMGGNYRKGNTYTWLPNHLMDGMDFVSPRSFLDALQTAVEVTESSYRLHEYPLHHEGLRRGVVTASKTRVTEIREDIRWVKAAVEPLQGMQVPVSQNEVVERWFDAQVTVQLSKEADRKNGDDDVRTGPRNPNDPVSLIEELSELGILRRRHDGRLDMPDVYRVAFGLGRKGGVPRVRR